MDIEKYSQQLNTLFSGIGAVIYVMYMNEVDVVIPDWVWYFSVQFIFRFYEQLSVSIYYTLDFCLTFYLAPNKWAFIFSEYFVSDRIHGLDLAYQIS